LISSLHAVAANDNFMSRLLEIYEKLPDDIVKDSVMLGLHRSDYMLNQEANAPISTLQVELNTIASSFGCLSKKVGDLHRYILNRNTNSKYLDMLLREAYPNISSTMSGTDIASVIPENPSIRNFGYAMAMAHSIFGDKTAVVLFVVQPGEKNIADQRLLEAELWNTHGIRSEFMTLAQIAATGQYAAENNELLVSPTGAAGVDVPVKVSVCYFRAGYTPNDYHSEQEWAARELIEFSSAIKCPSLGYHLAGSKKIQQVLCEAGVLEKFMKREDAILLRKCFAEQHSLSENGTSLAAQTAVEAAIRDGSCWVLKPQREGGGNNLYGAAVSAFLATNKDSSVLNGNNGRLAPALHDLHN